MMVNVLYIIIFQYMYDAVYEWCGHTNRENRLQAFLALEALLQQVRDRVAHVYIYMEVCRPSIVWLTA